MNMNVAQMSGEVGTFVDTAVAWAAVAVPRFVGALVLLVVGWWIAGRAQRAIVAAAGRAIAHRRLPSAG